MAVAAPIITVPIRSVTDPEIPRMKIEKPLPGRIKTSDPRNTSFFNAARYRPMATLPDVLQDALDPNSAPIPPQAPPQTEEGTPLPDLIQGALARTASSPTGEPVSDEAIADGAFPKLTPDVQDPTPKTAAAEAPSDASLLSNTPPPPTETAALETHADEPGWPVSGPTEREATLPYAIREAAADATDVRKRVRTQGGLKRRSLPLGRKRRLLFLRFGRRVLTRMRERRRLHLHKVLDLRAEIREGAKPTVSTVPTAILRLLEVRDR
jgi:hypothetical protein